MNEALLTVSQKIALRVITENASRIADKCVYPEFQRQDNAATALDHTLNSLRDLANIVEGVIGELRVEATH